MCYSGIPSTTLPFPLPGSVIPGCTGCVVVSQLPLPRIRSGTAPTAAIKAGVGRASTLKNKGRIEVTELYVLLRGYEWIIVTSMPVVMGCCLCHAFEKRLYYIKYTSTLAKVPLYFIVSMSQVPETWNFLTFMQEFNVVFFFLNL